MAHEDITSSHYDKAKINEALRRFQQGHMVLVMDSEDRENEGDLIVAAEQVTAEQIAFIVRHSTGILCAPMLAADLDRLDLPLMVPKGSGDPFGTAFTITVDARRQVTTGVSPHDRATTFRLLADPENTASDFARPGHVFPLRCHPAGLMARQGHTEAAIELCKLTGKRPMAVIAEVVNEHDGSMARFDDLSKLGSKYDIPLITVSNLLRYISDRALDDQIQ